VGPLIEVPVMLFLVWSAVRLRPRLFPDPGSGQPSVNLEAAHAR